MLRRIPREARFAWAMAFFMLVCSALLMVWGLLAQQRSWRLGDRIDTLQRQHDKEFEELQERHDKGLGALQRQQAKELEELQDQIDKLEEWWTIDSRNLWVDVRTLQKTTKEGTVDDGE